MKKFIAFTLVLTFLASTTFAGLPVKADGEKKTECKNNASSHARKVMTEKKKKSLIKPKKKAVFAV